MKDKEAVFLQKINERRIEAYKVLYDDYYPALVVYASAFVLSDEVAEDIVQELFVSMWEKQLTFTSFWAFKTYLYKFVKNASINHLKHQDVEGRYAEYIKGLSLEEELSESELNNEEEYRLLFRTIDELPPRCREIFLMSLEGKKNKEIAALLQISIDTVKTQKMRAMQRLKESAGVLFAYWLSAYILTG